MGNKQTTENGQFGTMNKQQQRGQNLANKPGKSDWNQKDSSINSNADQSQSSFNEGDVQGSDV